MQTWDGKPYYSLDYYLKHRFGEKVYKIALDGGMTCPNRDGTLDTRGCIFCSAGGSGDFAAAREGNVTSQITHGIAGIKQSKSTGNKFIAYFQSYTNTYADISYLRPLFTEAISHPDVVGLSVGTRPDCLPEDVVNLLAELNQKKPVWVELGLQTIHEDTADFIRRGYSLNVFEEAVSALHENGLETVVHVILGLPGEDTMRILQTIHYLNTVPIQGIKLQLLHVLSGTDLGSLLGTFPIYTLEEYVDTVITCLEHLSPETIIHRLTGDGPKDLLLAPDWSTKKRHVLNTIHKTMAARNSYQGRYYRKGMNDI